MSFSSVFLLMNQARVDMVAKSSHRVQKVENVVESRGIFYISGEIYDIVRL